MTSAIRNPDGHWINSQEFRRDALHFLNNNTGTI